MPTDRPETTTEGVAAAKRALVVLSCFRDGDHHLSLAEITRRTGLVKSTVLRLIMSLDECGYLIKVADGYQLGNEIIRLYNIYNSAMGLDKVIVPVLHDLAESTQETAAFYTEHNGQRLCQFRVNSPQPLRLDIAPGSFRPMDNASSAQILKLFQRWPDEQPSIPALPLYTAGATNPHTASYSVPILGKDQRLIGALSITGPISRLTWEAAARIQEPLMQAASQLCHTLGGSLELVSPVMSPYPKP